MNDASGGQHVALAVLGPDRPGIVAEVTALLLELGCNLEDVTTSILRGQFTMMLVCTLPGSLAKAELDGRLADLGRRSHVIACAWEVPSGQAASVPTHALTVYGPDRMGIVRSVAGVLAGRQVNICDMSCRLHEGESALYVLSMEIEVPADPSGLETELAAALAPLGLEHALREVEPEVL